MTTAFRSLLGPALLLLGFLAVPAPLPAQDGSSSGRAEAAELLYPGDIVRLNVWREESFSGDFRVDRDGHVVLPRIGTMDVRGVPAPEVRDRIMAELARYLRNPSIEVVFLRRITVHGAVTSAGMYFVDPTMTVLDALAQAGGARPEGRLDQIRLIRDGREIMTIPTTGLQIGELEVRSGDQLYVPEPRWFRRNSAVVAAGISAVASLLIALVVLANE